jgi:hypothetical protein
VLQCSDGPSNKASNCIRRHIDNRKLLVICILLLSHSFIFFRFYFFYQYMVVFLFDTVIYVFLLLGICICVGVLFYALVCVYFPSKHNDLANLLCILYYSIQINYCLFILQYTNHQLHVSASIGHLQV